MDKLINDVTEFVTILSEIDIDNDKNVELKKYKHIDIDLMKENEIDWVQITHCSFSDSYLYNSIGVLSNVICQKTIENSDRLILVIFKPNTCDYEYIYDFNKFEPISKVSSITHNSHLKQYLAIKIMHKLNKKELNSFKICLSQKLNDINEIYPNFKYTFHCGIELLYNTLVSMDEIFNSCKLLSSAIENVIVSSTNDEFREQCSQSLNTIQTGILNQTIFNKLFGLFNNNYELENK